MIRLFLLFPLLSPIDALSMSLSSVDKAISNSLGGTVLRDLVLKAAKHEVSKTLDLHGIVWTEHINLVVGSKEQAEYFLLGLSRLDTGCW